MMSSNLFGIMSRMSVRIPGLASWNVPTVLPLCMSLKVSGSSIGIDVDVEVLVESFVDEVDRKLDQALVLEAEEIDLQKP